jgi:isopentenyl-diphosphate delta-isomerase
MGLNKMFKTENRKHEHVKVSIDEDVSSYHNYWDYIKLIHNALPEINKSDIDLSIDLFGKRLEAPIIISSMTGGYKKGRYINENLALTAEKFQLGMGVGSQRAGIENPNLRESYEIVKNYDIPLRFANIGASQIVIWGHKKTLERAYDMIDMINADVFIVCLNFLQEAVMHEGESNARGVYEAIERLSDDLGTPVVVKESGAGISYDVAKKLFKTKISGIDVGGLGGTSFAAIEHYRAKIVNDNLHARGGKTFWDWGIPTPTSILMTGEATNWSLPIIATGGIRNGLDAAKALVLGANAAGIARILLKPAIENLDATLDEMNAIIKELRATMYLLGVGNLSKMTNVDWMIVGDKLWI